VGSRPALRHLHPVAGAATVRGGRCLRGHKTALKLRCFEALGRGIDGAVPSGNGDELQRRRPEGQRDMRTEINGVTRVRDIVVGFLLATGLFTLALAGGHPPPGAAASSVTEWVPSSMHVAEAGADVGPGSDEALLVTSPVGP
jgi:hypothetical protein